MLALRRNIRVQGAVSPFGPQPCEARGSGGRFSEGQPQFLTVPPVGEHVEILDHKSMSVANTHAINPQHNGTYVTHSRVEGRREIVLSLRREW